MTRLGIFGHEGWLRAARKLGLDHEALPVPKPGPGDSHITARATAGAGTVDRLRRRPVDLLLDADGDGFQYLAGLGRMGGDQPVEAAPESRQALEVRVLHHVVGAPLVSWFARPIRISRGGGGDSFEPAAVALDSWLKLCGDRGHVHELQQMGAANVLHMPAAAVDWEGPRGQLDPRRVEKAVAFVGPAGAQVADGATRRADRAAGLLAWGDGRGEPTSAFYDTYCSLLQLGAAPRLGAGAAGDEGALQSYLAAQRVFLGARAISRRDRFVAFLARQAGDLLRVYGDGWTEAYGISSAGATSDAPARDGALQHLIHLDLPEADCEHGISPRAFEVAAAGGFLLSYFRPELAELFEIGRECDVFRNEAELLEKVRYYVAHPQRAAEIAQAGQRRTLRDHLYSHRLAAILKLIRLPESPRAPIDAGEVFFSLGRWIDECRAALPEADVILDCGAFVGTTARMLREAWPTAQIICFEPVRTVHEQLAAAAPRIGVSAVRSAVADFDGEADINLAVSDQSASLLTPLEDGNPLLAYQRVIGRERVPVCTLDAWCAAQGIEPRRVSLVKLSVQGAELAALRGARGVLRHARAVFVQTAFSATYENMPTLAEIDAFLASCGLERRALYPTATPAQRGEALYVRAAAPADVAPVEAAPSVTPELAIA